MPTSPCPPLQLCPFTHRRYRTLRSLNLPCSLEALERPIGLPPSFLKKAEEVRSEQGPERIETYLEHVELLGRRAMAVLDEVWKEEFLPVAMYSASPPGDGYIGQ